MAGTVKITPRIAAQVARRLRLAASVRSRSMSALVNDALDKTLPSLEEIRMQLAPPAGEPDPGTPAAPASHAGLVTVATHGALAAPAQDEGTSDGGVR